VPVGTVLTGLRATLGLRLTTGAGTRDVRLQHDFWEEPVLVLTPASLA
jgi:hypothetical protein